MKYMQQCTRESGSSSSCQYLISSCKYCSYWSLMNFIMGRQLLKGDRMREKCNPQNIFRLRVFNTILISQDFPINEVLIRITLMVGDVGMRVILESLIAVLQALLHRRAQSVPRKDYTGQHSQNCLRLSLYFTEEDLTELSTFYSISNRRLLYQFSLLIWSPNPGVSMTVSFIRTFSPRYLCKRWPTILNQITNTQ